MNMISKILPVILLIMQYLPVAVYSHGVDIMLTGGGTGIEARYDSGDPVSHAEVTIYSPADPEEPFQTGVTDRNGRFLFSPDADGEWKVVISDWTGHGGTKRIRFAADPEGSGQETVSDGPVSRWMKVISGISVIFGITGILFFAAARRERKRGMDAHS